MVNGKPTASLTSFQTEAKVQARKSTAMMVLHWLFAWLLKVIFTTINPFRSPSLPASWRADPMFQASIFRHPRVIEVILRLTPEERRAFEREVRTLYAYIGYLISFINRYVELEDHHIKTIREGLGGPLWLLDLETPPKQNQSWVGRIPGALARLTRGRMLYFFLIPVFLLLYLTIFS